ncbi:DUF1934 domain-containing protein [Salinicoccus albus]|uniref:DUF1934 domain-containing protein n=1 Tax=Salinicoccus albus TaxID=418756 RepID=UPI00035FC5CC|nr:DUF1934 domain-containing protein [Salinicoccus albus]
MKGQVSQFKIRQSVDMNNEIKTFEQNADVEIIDKKDRYFRYTERLDEYEIDVVLRAGNDFVKIQRRGIIDMNFHFEAGRTTDTFYESPAGRHFFRIHTDALAVDDARIDIRYQLIEGEDVIGHYHYKLEKEG